MADYGNTIRAVVNRRWPRQRLERARDHDDNESARYYARASPTLDYRV